MASPIAERFMRYVQIDTQSDPTSTTYPSTEKQYNLLKLLEQELRQMGIDHVELDANGYVIATIPTTTKQVMPVICFCAHVDTAPDCSGTDVKPLLHNEYDGSDIVLPDDPHQVIRVSQYPYLKNHIGKSIITASGKTLLGADDKAGVAIIMEMARYCMEHPEMEHGEIKILFTPDEEVGMGTAHLDIKKLNADFGYTLDGGALASFEMETFSADGFTLHIDGVIAHPGYAKGVMQSAIKLAAAIVSALPTDSWCPEMTSEKQGFVHPVAIYGEAEKAKIDFIIRDFDSSQLPIYGNRIMEIANNVIATNKQFDKCSIRFEQKEQYRNMKEILDQYPEVVNRALKAYRDTGLEPVIEPIRGGTDGSRMSFMGLPCPNIFTGMQAIHSRHEWVGVADMEKAVEVLINLVKTS